MPGQIVEITQPGYWLKKHRGFLVVQKGSEEQGRIPLDDILSVLISVPGCSLSTVLIDELSQNNIPLVICGANYLPSSMLLPVSGYGRQFHVMRAQADLSQPRRKRAWQSVVKAKILNQAELLERIGQDTPRLRALARKVKSGDPENCEGQAARLYWPRLFGRQFRRDRHADGINAVLNYTYTIVRSCVARGISGAGLHPTFSLHHRNPHNPINLVDDVMEPFRPIADYLVWQLRYDDDTELTPEVKSRLSPIVNLPLPMEQQSSPLSLVAARVCRALADYCLGEEDSFPAPQLPTAKTMAAR